ncbi:type IV pilus modification protein PilV [Saccharospirillum sp.]|uniref:type IV pilus modification protein PilV n=1 Tax=Saccharospirillum sp. TaxID=2033801 RepID=UPI0034A06425
MFLTGVNPIVSKQSGYSLIEVLVTVVVLAVGLLGVAGVQALGLRTANVALDHNRVTVLATDMAERIRANPIGFRDDHYSVTMDEANPPPAATCSEACTPETRAGSDLAGWYDRLMELDQASAVIETNASVAQITINWVDPGIGFGGQNADEAQSFVYQTRLRTP